MVKAELVAKFTPYFDYRANKICFVLSEQKRGISTTKNPEIYILSGPAIYSPSLPRTFYQL